MIEWPRAEEDIPEEERMEIKIWQGYKRQKEIVTPSDCMGK